ncbi:MAG: cold shock domain-containing protein [Planctomycetes bacterium]|nr:cold shock domain-containing protein [Planctomycetota bacterium]
MASTGTVVRFDRRRGYGFVQPDDGGEDVFVHQNNINMEGFRFLQVGERVTYELEVGEKGMKAVSVALVEPRAARPGREDDFGGGEGGYDDRDDRDASGYQQQEQRAPRERESRPPRAAADRDAPVAASSDKASRKLERLISLLVEKGVLAPGEIDGLAQGAVAGAPGADA